METLLLWLGRVAGLSGLLICALAFGVRLMGAWYLGSVPVATLLQAGMAAMIFACLAYCACIAERTRK
jgi:hypothetical protein